MNEGALGMGAPRYAADGRRHVSIGAPVALDEGVDEGRSGGTALVS